MRHEELGFEPRCLLTCVQKETFGHVELIHGLLENMEKEWRGRTDAADIKEVLVVDHSADLGLGKGWLDAEPAEVRRLRKIHLAAAEFLGHYFHVQGQVLPREQVLQLDWLPICDLIAYLKRLLINIVLI